MALAATIVVNFFKIAIQAGETKKTAPAFHYSLTNRQAVLGWPHFTATVNIDQL